jgi:hypothetical protein
MAENTFYQPAAAAGMVAIVARRECGGERQLPWEIKFHDQPNFPLATPKIAAILELQ